MFKKLKITCDEATTICDKSQYKEASLFELIKLNFHFIGCKICRLYTKQNSKMSGLFKIKSLDCKDKNNCMSKADKEALKKQFEEIKR
ncbi:hypothetical protein [Polaribacter ponticola]|uniref:Glycine dehydrogenase n=1 Tax=Polaribacter ponticola TaxID=2978475 RepID=A0ABT5SBR8_9FLAO|nr:hypothetical protein [Polaribacter sp. MSW5]MDD7915562.1 hypothetical protein [Polaribacter sp. MSW5]